MSQDEPDVDSCVGSFAVETSGATVYKLVDLDTLGKVTVMCEGDITHIVQHFPELLYEAAAKSLRDAGFDV